jgi:cytochrome c peroxidase
MTLALAASALVGVAGLAPRAALAQPMPPVPVPPQNPITPEKAVLGKILFWDEQLSTSLTMSCGSCHQPNRAGADPRQARHAGPDAVLNTGDDRIASPGVISSDANNDYVRDALFALNPQITDRAANSNINAAFAPSLFWDGRARGEFRDPVTNAIVIPTGGALETQAVGPLVNDIEMVHDNFDWAQVVSRIERSRPLDLATNHPADVAAALVGQPDYPELFRRAFGDNAITPTRIAFAIATYQRTLISNQTPWDAFIAGNPSAMTPQQTRGWNAFQASNCNACHVPPLFTGNSFRNVGLRPPAEDLGLQLTTGNPADRGKFKVPGLRNVGLKTTFMHNGQFNPGATPPGSTPLTEVIRFYARAPGAPVQFPDNRDPIMVNVNVPPPAAADIEAFLRGGLLDQRVQNQTAPFDRPTLAAQRPETRPTLIPANQGGGGVAGSGGLIPAMIVESPGMVGNLDFRLGVSNALGGANARLILSSQPPVNGRIAPERTLAAEITTSGSGNGQGVATIHWPLSAGTVRGGQVLFAQWMIADAGGSGGFAFSNVARIPFFCGTMGCPAPCDYDFNQDQNTDLTDAQQLAAVVAGIITPNASWLSGDVNGDENVDITDAQLIANYSVNGTCSIN